MKSNFKAPWKVVHDPENLSGKVNPSRPMIMTGADYSGAPTPVLTIHAHSNNKWGAFEGEEELHQLVVNAVNSYLGVTAEGFNRAAILNSKQVEQIRQETLKTLASAIKKVCPEVVPKIIEASVNPLDDFLAFLRKE